MLLDRVVSSEITDSTSGFGGPCVGVIFGDGSQVGSEACCGEDWCFAIAAQGSTSIFWIDFPYGVLLTAGEGDGIDELTSG